MICNNPSSGSRGLFRTLNLNFQSNFLVTSNPSFGLSNSSITVSNGNFVCSFVRDNTLTAPGSFSIANNAPVYLIAAFNNGGTYIFGSFYVKKYL
jgi:hypothetical protein